MAVIATMSGTAIRPGISKNNRLYTAEAIGRMVERAQNRIGSSDDMPITMLTSHSADDDSTHLVGQLLRIWQEDDGSAKFEAAIDDTKHGRDIATLATPSAPGRKPTLKGVSIRGAWRGKVRTEIGPDGQRLERGDDVELDGLDFTRKPGVTGAVIDSVEHVPSEPRESDGTSRVPITESAPEASVTITETEAPTPGPFADHGYLGESRFPVGTRAEAKAAWLALTESTTARQYTAAQLKRVKQRVGKALKGHGVTVETTEGWLIDPPAPLTECFGYSDDPDHGGSIGVTLSNGPVTVTVSSYCVDPHDLDAVGRAAMAGACSALALIDPDADGDADVPGAVDTDTAMAAAETAPAVAGDALTQEHASALRAAGLESGTVITPTVLEGALASVAPTEAAPSIQTPAPDSPAAETTQEKEPAMAESTNPAGTTPGTDSGLDALSAKFDKLTDAITGLVTKMAPAPAVEAAPVAAAAVAEAAPVAETDDQRIARLVTEGIKAALPQAIQESVERNGPPVRKGLVTQVTEHSATTTGAGLNSQGLPSDWPDKELHTYTDEERARYFAPQLEAHVFGKRV